MNSEEQPEQKVREKSSFSENATSLQCISTLRNEIEKKEKEAQESNAQWLNKMKGMTLYFFCNSAEVTKNFKNCDITGDKNFSLTKDCTMF